MADTVYRVYVIELDESLRQGTGKPAVYVGQSAKTPEERFEQHLRRERASRYVRDHGGAAQASALQLLSIGDDPRRRGGAREARGGQTQTSRLHRVRRSLTLSGLSDVIGEIPGGKALGMLQTMRSVKVGGIAAHLLDPET